MSEWMNPKTFLKNHQEITTAVTVLMNSPKSRKRFRILELHTARGGELIAEVFRTFYGPVIVYRATARTSWQDGDEESGDDSFRQGRRRPAVEPLTDDPDHRFVMMGRDGSYVVKASDIHDLINHGVTRSPIQRGAPET